jgi:glycosyltransferase involved in cell wall biosynthesis
MNPLTLEEKNVLGRFMPTKNILIIIPAYNEEANIVRTIEEIYEQGLPVSVVVVNDGSTDRTAAMAQGTKAHVVSLPFNLGIGGAVQTGFKFALEKGYEVAIQVDGDTQHDVSYLKDLLDPVLSGEVDMTIGSRFRFCRRIWDTVLRSSGASASIFSLT